MKAGHAGRSVPSADGTGAPDISETTMPPMASPSALSRLFPRKRHCGELSARSTAMHELFELIERFAKTNVTATLLGETGVGKDVVARVLHKESARSNQPFVVFDCGAVASSLAESELLGHERGSFTGALAGHPGAFERAHGGTLFLDEIAELPLDLQPRLLRALESQSIRRVGGRQERRVNVRVLAATNRNLRARVAEGRFREDLFFRLAVAVLPVPPLRDRFDDLPILVPQLLADLGHTDLRVGDPVYDALRGHSWPGNVRELKNALAWAAAFVDRGSNTLLARHLRLLPCAPPATAIEFSSLGGQTLERIERAAVWQTMLQVDGNTANAARSLGIAVSTLHEKLKKHGL